MKYAFPLLCVLLLTLCSCKRKVVSGEGNMVTGERTVSPSFDGITIEDALSATVSVSPGAPVSVRISGYENLLPLIKTEVKGNELRVYVSETYDLENDDSLHISITVPRLKRIASSGASHIDIPATLRTDELEVKASGASEIMLSDVQVARLKAEVSGASLLTLGAGSISKLEASVSGSSKLAACGVQAADARLDVSGASGANVNAIQTLQAEASGASVVTYKGTPQVKSETSGAGSVSRAE